MEKALHTAGPWKVDVWKNDNEPFQRYSIVSESDIGELGAAIVISGEYYDCPLDAANARLIAAAPELLEALEEYINELPSGMITEKSVAALKLAKGE